jgi:hypothetical protein
MVEKLNICIHGSSFCSVTLVEDDGPILQHMEVHLPQLSF